MQTSPQFQTICDKLENVKQNGSGLDARCPAHKDEHNSLSIGIGDDGRILLRCHAGCTTAAVCNAMGIALKDLFPAKSVAGPRRVVATYDYTDEQGNLLFQKVRFEPKDFQCRIPDAKGGWGWKMNGVRRVLYHLPAVIASDVVFIAEGEKDCDLLAKQGYAATCNFDGAGKWDASYTPLFRDKVVYILADNDTPGKRHAANIYRQIAAAAKDCRIVELPGLPEKGDVSDFFANGGTTEQFMDALSAAPKGIPESFKTDVHADPEADASGEVWGPILPFDEMHLPEFPMDTIPACLSGFAQIVRHISSSHQTPPDMTALLLVTIAAACLGGKLKIVTNNRYAELVTLFTAIFAPSGTRKSSVYHSLMKPVIEYQMRLRTEMKAQIEGNRNERDILKKQIERLIKDIVKSSGEETSALRDELTEKEAQLAGFDKPTELPLIYMETDFTVESLAPKINVNGGFLALFDHEGAFWNEVAGRYTQGQSQTNDLILKSYDGHPVTVSRVGRGDIFIEQCCLSIGLIVQPSKIEDLKNKKMLDETGLIPRFLLSVPVDTVGYRQVQTAAVPHYVYTDYNSRIEKLFKLRQQDEMVLTMDKATTATFVQYCQSIETRLREGSDLYAIRAWASKLTGRIARTAAVLHCFAYPDAVENDSAVDPAIMDYAIGLSDYLIEHAKATYQILNLSADVKIARKLLRTLEKYAAATKKLQITKGELWSRVKNSDKGIQTVAAITGGLDILADHNYICRVDPEARPGRPAEIYALNPKHFGTPQTL